MNEMIRRLLYAFKQQWGGQFDYVQILSSEADYRTGDRNIQKAHLRFEAVKLPEQTLRKFIQDIGYLAANKNFTYGGLNDFNTLRLLISSDDFPPEFKPDLNGYIVHNHKRYERVQLDNVFGVCWVLQARGVEGANPYAQSELAAFSYLTLTQKVKVELN